MNIGRNETTGFRDQCADLDFVSFCYYGLGGSTDVLPERNGHLTGWQDGLDSSTG